MDKYKRIVTYNDYDHLMDKLVDKIDGHTIHGELKYVYGIERGGLPIAVHMSHLLDLKFVTDNEFHEQFTQSMREKTLIVDDVINTGETLKEIGSVYNYNPISAVLFLRKRSDFTPNYWIEISDQELVMPWEKYE